MSKSSLDKVEDYVFLKQKNEKMVKELASLKGAYSKLQSDLDYLMREKFIIEQRANRAERVILEIDTRSKICLNKMVEVSTEFTRIFELIRNTKIRDNNEIFGDIPITEEVNNELNTENNSLKDIENLTEENIDEENENSNDLSFESRGGRSLPKNHHFPIAESDIAVEEDDGNVEYSNSLVDKSVLTVIPEEDEDSSYSREEIDHRLTLLNSSSGNLFTELPKSLRRREHAIQENDSSITVETNNSFENSDDNDNTLKDDQNASTVTLRKQSETSQQNSPKPTPKRISFIKRKSIGSPVPQSLECRGSKRRKSDSPISTLKNKKPRKSYTDTRKSLEDLGESHTNEQSSRMLRTTSRSSLFQTKDLSHSAVQSRCLNDSDNSLGCEPITNNDYILNKSKEDTGSYLEKTITQGNNSNYKADWHKNTSTPIPTQEPQSIETKFNNSKVCSRRKELQTKPSTSKDYYLDETVVSEESEEELSLIARMKNKSKSTIRKKRSRITCRVDAVSNESNSSVDGHYTNNNSDDFNSQPIRRSKRIIGPEYNNGPKKRYWKILMGIHPDAETALEENESFSSPRNRRPRTNDSNEMVVQRLAENKRKKKPKKLEKQGRSSSDVNDTQHSSPIQQKSKNENADSLNQQQSNRSSENEDFSDQSDSPVSTKINKKRRAITSSDDDEYMPNGNKSNEKSETQTGGSKVVDEINSSVDDHLTHNNSNDFDSQPVSRRSLRVVSPGYNNRPNKRYWNIFMGLNPDADTTLEESQSFSSPRNRRSLTSGSNKKVVQRITEKKKTKTLKKLEQEGRSTSNVNDTQRSSSIPKKSKNENTVSQYQQESNRSSENEDFQDQSQSPVSTKRNKKRRAVTSSEDESALNEDKRSAGRSKRAVKKVEYKEPSLHVKLRRH
ncbi:dentin sialophosphoprotein-like isoform X2 [Harmonia axyridis]|uniref:dentin sialophosphoprotein-like isoform X2 n=1 Tax=Harmonia axyridis TaxID=115357 RepID=UPI001E278ACF|nr:dentin sialophosphoprotein-like isoform X2 [Harmonia axyridis]